MLKQLEALEEKISELIQKRDDLLKDLRRECKHLKLVELEAGPSRRICVDCGAEEVGWYCGYHVLVMTGDNTKAPFKEERVLVEITSDPDKFFAHCKNGPRYLVGQSHPNYGGLKTYEQLTEVV